MKSHNNIDLAVSFLNFAWERNLLWFRQQVCCSRGEGRVFKFLLVPPPKSVMNSRMCPTYSALQGLPYAFWLCLGLCFCCCFHTLRYLYSDRPPYPAPYWHLGLSCGVPMPTPTPGSSPNWPATMSWWFMRRFMIHEKKHTRLITKKKVIYPCILA